MDTNFAARILALPESVRVSLATVEGPGWMISPRGNALLQTAADPPLLDGYAWWSANPARSVAAVFGASVWFAHRIIADDGSADGDHTAALSIIEAHVARSKE